MRAVPVLATLLYTCTLGLCGISRITPSLGPLSFARAAGGDVHSIYDSYEGSTLELFGQNEHGHAKPLHDEDPSEEIVDGIVSDMLLYAAPSRKLLHGCHGNKCDATTNCAALYMQG